MRLFRVQTRSEYFGARTAEVLASASSPREDWEVAQDAAIDANTDPNPIFVQVNVALSDAIGIDARSGGTGPAKVFFSTGTDYIGRATEHWIAAKDKGLLTILPWSNSSTYFTFSISVSYSGHNYKSKVNGNIGHQPNISPFYWELDDDAQARETARVAAVAVDAKPPDWDVTTTYAIAAKVRHNNGNWFATSENIGVPPPSYWIAQLVWFGPNPTDWDPATAYTRGDFAYSPSSSTVYFCSEPCTNKDPDANSTAAWAPDTITVQEALVKVGLDVDIEA